MFGEVVPFMQREVVIGGTEEDLSSSERYIGFNASRCSGIYGASSTVQPPSQIVHYCIKYK